MKPCNRNQCCPLDEESGIKCRYCRFMKCLSVGMKPHKVQVGIWKNCIQDKVNRIAQESQQVSCLKESNSLTLRDQTQWTCVNNSNVNKTLDTRPELVQTNSCTNTYSYLVTSLPPKLPLSHPANHGYLRLKRSFDSGLDYNILDMTSIPCRQYDVVLEVSVKDGYICGTNMLLVDFLAKEQLPGLSNDALSDVLHLSASKGGHFFSRNQFNEVEIQLLNNITADTKIMTMRGISQDLWYRMHETVSASKFLKPILTLSQFVTPYSSLPSNGPVQLKLTKSLETCANHITAAIESLDAYNEFSVCDQIIVLKEAYLPICFLLAAFTYCPQNECQNYWSPNGQLYLTVHLSKWKKDGFRNGKEMYDFYKTCMTKFLPFLKEDYFVIILLCMLCVFQERPGLSCNQVIYRERNLYLNLFDKYIETMVKSGHYPETQETIWNNINSLMDYWCKYSEILMKIECELSR